MRNQSGKTKQSHRSKQRSGGSSTDNRRDQNRDDEGLFTGERHSGDRPPDPSRSPSSNFGDDEIGGTSFDPGPFHSEAKGRDEHAAKKASGTPGRTDNKKNDAS